MSSISFNITGAQSKTNWALLLLIVIMPLRNIQLQYIPNLGGGLNILNVLFLLSFIHAVRNGKQLAVKPKINGFLVWFILTSLVSLIFGYNFLAEGANGLWKAMKDSLIPVFLVFIIQRSAVDDIQWRRILVATLLPLPYCFKVVWAQYVSVSSWHYSHDLRISGTFMDLGANEMAAYAVTMSLISLGCLISCWSIKKWRYIFMLCFIFSALSLLYSYSRGGYVAFLLGSLIIFGKFKHRKKIIIPLILATTLGLANLPKSVEERFSTINAEEEDRDASAESRFVFWAIAFDKFLERPAFGFGYHTAQDKRINPHEMDTHNYFVKMLVERGLLGFITFIVLLRVLWNLTKRNLNWSRNDPLQYGVILGLSGAIMALTLGNMFGDRFSHYPIMTCFWTFVGLVSIIESRRMEEDEQKQRYIHPGLA